MVQLGKKILRRFGFVVLMRSPLAVVLDRQICRTGYQELAAMKPVVTPYAIARLFARMP
jgi:hypothetical protein